MRVVCSTSGIRVAHEEAALKWHDIVDDATDATRATYFCRRRASSGQASSGGGHTNAPSGSQPSPNHVFKRNTPCTKAFSTTYWLSCKRMALVYRVRNNKWPSGHILPSNLCNIYVASFGLPNAKELLNSNHSKSLDDLTECRTLSTPRTLPKWDVKRLSSVQK